MLSITHHEGNKSQNHNEVPPHTCQNGHHQKQERMWRKENPLLHCWWECQLVQPPQKPIQRYLKKLTLELPHGQFQYWIFIQRKWKQEPEKISAPHVHCSIIYNSQDIEKT